MRPRIARWLRKWADLIDPRIGPSSQLTVTIECDSSQFMAGTNACLVRIDELREAMRLARLG